MQRGPIIRQLLLCFPELFDKFRAGSHQRTSFKCHNIFDKNKIVATSQRHFEKKTKGVIIITIALHVLLASWYISRHGRLVQISNNQAGPRGENVGKMWQVNYFFSPPFIGTNWFPPHSFVPTPVLSSFHDLTSAHKHFLPPIAEKVCLLFFSTIQTKHNSQSTTYCYLVL